MIVRTSPDRREPTFWEKVDETFAMWLWLGWLPLYMALCLLLVYMFLFGASVVWPTALAGMLVLLAVALPSPSPTSEHSAGWRRLGRYVMGRAARYLSLSVEMDRDTLAVLEERRAKGKPVVFGLEPHGVLPISIIFASDYLDYVPCTSARGLMSSACFVLPFMKQVYSACSAAPVDKGSFLRLLDRGMSCTIVPGGVREVSLLPKGGPRDLHIYLSGRKGFIKYALLKGAAIVPSFAFGVQDSFSFRLPPEPLRSLGRAIGFVPMAYFGACGVPFGIPKRRPVSVVLSTPIVGESLPADAGDAEIARRVDAAHGAYVDALQRLFEEHKGRLGMGDYTLHVE